MKKIVSMLAACVLLCGPVLGQAALAGNNLDSLLAKAAQENEQPQGTLAQRLGAPETYAVELTDPKGKVYIHGDAAVEVPDANGVPVVKVVPNTISQAQADVLMRALLRGEAFDAASYRLTKDEITAMIAQIEQVEQTGAEETGRQMQARMMREYTLGVLREQLTDAPETNVRTAADGQFETMDLEVDWATGQRLTVLAESPQGGYESLSVYNFTGDQTSLASYTAEANGFEKNPGYYQTVEDIELSTGQAFADIPEYAGIPDVTVTLDEAKAQADSLLAELGVTGMVCTTAQKQYGGEYTMTADQTRFLNPRRAVWFLRYARSVGGVPITHTVYDCIKVADASQESPWAYEDMYFLIDDTGIVGFRWISPYTVGETVTDNSKLISFAQAASVFQTMAVVVNSWEHFSADNPRLQNIAINVTHITFGLTRITDETDRHNGYLVPAWDFIGDITWQSRTDGADTSFVETSVPILTVNAIDGSVINRSLGY